MLIALPAVMVGAAQPVPSDPDLACIVDRVPASERESLVGEVTSNTRGPIWHALREAGEHCAQQAGWDEDYARATEMAAIAHLLRQAALAGLQRAEIPTPPIDAWVEELPPNQRNLAEMPTEVLVPLLERLRTAGVRPETIASPPIELVMYVFGQVLWKEAAAYRRR